MNRISKTLALIFVIAAIIFAEGCTQKKVTPVNETITPVNGTLENGQVITEKDSGKAIIFKKGESFTLILRENPSTGYFWYLNVSNGLSILSDYFTQDPAPPGYVGVPGNHTWVIKATSLGTQQVYGSHEQHSRSVPDVIENFTLRVEVV